jgi:hypothetical protein
MLKKVNVFKHETACKIFVFIEVAGNYTRFQFLLKWQETIRGSSVVILVPSYAVRPWSHQL